MRKGRMMPKLSWALLGLWIFGFGCATVSSDNKEPPKITAEMPFEQAIQIALVHGGKRLEDFKAYAKSRQSFAEVSRYAEKLIISSGQSMPLAQLIHAAHLYRFSSPKLNPQIVETLLQSGAEASRKRIGWQLAGLMPSNAVSQAIERVMSRAVLAGNENQYIMPEMADAVLQNHIASLYSFMRLGLLGQGNDNYAKAMSVLQPEKAARDFVDYLALASLDDLRQMNQETVNMYTCLVILRFYLEHPLPVADSKVSHLYLYAVSRNNALSEMARAVLDRQIPSYKDQLLYYLSRQPLEVQMAFVEGTRHSPSANIKLMLNDFKTMTAFREVEQEIESINRY